MWMNRCDIEEAVRRNNPRTAQGLAARYLHAHMIAIDEQSDGWPYWQPASKAARGLMALADRNGTDDMHALQKALIVLRAFYTRHPQLQRPDILAARPGDLRRATAGADSYCAAVLLAGPL